MQVLLIDDHPIIREILPAIVEQALGTVEVRKAGTIEEGIKCIEACPDLRLVLLDLGLPGYRGLQALKEIRQQFPSLKVVVVSAETDRDTIVGALAAGAAGYVPKTSGQEIIVSALRIITAGKIYVPQEALQYASNHDSRLSPRQREVLRLLLLGLSNREIAAQLSITDSTVKQHVGCIYETLSVRTRAQAMAIAARGGHIG